MTVIIENANAFGFLDEADLTVFEKRIEAQLPHDYREFIKKYNGGEPKPAGFWIKKDKDGSSVNLLYGLFENPKHYSIGGSISQEWKLHDSLLPIGDDGTGNLICIVVKGETKGNIYFVDHEIYVPNETGSFTGITKLADTFSEFLSNLQKLPE
jgi:hypothetical protein